MTDGCCVADSGHSEIFVRHAEKSVHPLHVVLY